MRSSVYIWYMGLSTRQSPEMNACRLGRCVYDRQEQNLVINEIFDQALVLERKNKREFGQRSPLTQAVLDHGVFFKHPSFLEEDEWRLVTGPRDYRNDKFRFKTGRSMPIPYYALDIREDDWTGKIQEISIGPCPHPNSALAALQGLFMHHRVLLKEHSMPAIHPSVIPYRNW
jgi:hypothetical protein